MDFLVEPFFFFYSLVFAVLIKFLNREMPPQIEFRGSITHDYLYLVQILDISFWVIILIIWRKFNKDSSVRLFSNFFMGVTGLTGSAVSIYFLRKHVFDLSKEIFDQGDIDLMIFIVNLLLCSYLIEMLIRTAEPGRSPAVMITLHHFLSIGWSMIYLGRATLDQRIFPLVSVMNYFRLVILQAGVALWDFVGEFGFLGYRFWSKSHPAFAANILKFLFYYGVVIRLFFHTLFLVFFIKFVVQGQLEGKFKWFVLVIQLILSAIEYYYVIVLKVIIKRLETPKKHDSSTEEYETIPNQNIEEGNSRKEEGLTQYSSTSPKDLVGKEEEEGLELQVVV